MIVRDRRFRGFGSTDDECRLIIEFSPASPEAEACRNQLAKSTASWATAAPTANMTRSQILAAGGGGGITSPMLTAATVTRFVQSGAIADPTLTAAQLAEKEAIVTAARKGASSASSAAQAAAAAAAVAMDAAASVGLKISTEVAKAGSLPPTGERLIRFSAFGEVSGAEVTKASEVASSAAKTASAAATAATTAAGAAVASLASAQGKPYVADVQRVAEAAQSSAAAAMADAALAERAAAQVAALKATILAAEAKTAAEKAAADKAAAEADKAEVAAKKAEDVAVEAAVNQKKAASTAKKLLIGGGIGLAVLLAFVFLKRKPKVVAPLSGYHRRRRRNLTR
jgi:hypothetical protein